MTPTVFKQRLIWAAFAVGVGALIAGIAKFTEVGQYLLALVGLS